MSNKLMRCVESLRDTRAALLPLVLAADPVADKRQVKQALVPAFNLAVGLRDLYQGLQNGAWGDLTSAEQNKLAARFQAFKAGVNTKDGAIKTARDKIGAHMDKDIFKAGPRKIWAGFDLTAILTWVSS